MTVLIIDGPEKTGKTTTIELVRNMLSLRGVKSEYIHWGMVSDYIDYADLLQKHTKMRDVIYVWDRAWPSEYVYGKLLNREFHTMTNDPWLGAWCLDRAADANGLKVILLPDNIEAVRKERDQSDMKVPVLGEVMLYNDYARMFGWDVYKVRHSTASQVNAAEQIVSKLMNRMHMVSDPTRVCGPINSPVMFIGEVKSNQYIPGGFLPFSSRFTTMFGRDLGNYAIQSRWSNISDVVPEDFRLIDLVVLCGQVAYTEYHNYIGKEVSSSTRVIAIPHPSYLYRYNTTRVRLAKETALEQVNSVLKEI